MMDKWISYNRLNFGYKNGVQNLIPIISRCNKPNTSLEKDYEGSSLTKEENKDVEF